MNKFYNAPDNYLYLYHTGIYILLPAYADGINDSAGASFSNTTIMGRSADIYSYSHTGNRSFQISLNLHRELMYDLNYNNLSIPINNLDDDYVDILIKQIQAAVLPNYAASKKMVNPPIVALRMSNDIYCKGIINGSVSVSYNMPIIGNNKYAAVNIGFTITEINPFDAEEIQNIGSNRIINDIELARVGTRGVNSLIYPTNHIEGNSQLPLYSNVLTRGPAGH